MKKPTLKERLKWINKVAIMRPPIHESDAFKIGYYEAGLKAIEKGSKPKQ